ncbi:MAG: aldose 1-epimerase family protein [Neisseriaceae bacterium]|nr:aldose 1-epimerase family protein [Neisseriaceae bacterium]
MIILENAQLRVAIKPIGAELASLLHKTTGIEHLWQANPLVWGWHAPNLFPFIGRAVGDEYRFNGQIYASPKHGFARTALFDKQQINPTQAVFSLKANEQTRAVYPFEFEFQVVYTLQAETLQVIYRVINLDTQILYCQIGGHPAFNVPFFAHERYEDYQIEFAQPETELISHQVDLETGLLLSATDTLPLLNNALMLTPNLFNQDALVLKSLNSRAVTLKTHLHSHSVTVNFADFTYLGLWAKPNSPYVCVEPWLGSADTFGFTGELSEKNGVISITPTQIFEACMSITLT